MADTKITALTAITTVDPAVDVLPIVDVSDTSMAASGTTKKITSNQILGAGGTATLASATVTGNATAAAFIPSGSTVPTNGTYLPSANTVGWAVNSTNAMTLNSTGLGVGLTPAAGDGSAAFKAYGTGSLTANSRVGLDVRELVSGNQAGIILGAMTTENTAVIGTRTGSGNIAFQTYYAGSWGERMRIANDGNVGIGVTPITGAGLLQFPAGNLIGNQSDNFGISSNAKYVGGYKYVTGGKAALLYLQQNGIHSWHNSAVGTNANDPLTFTQAMTLDASGNLLVGKTSSANSAAGVNIYKDATDGGRVYLTRESGSASQTNVAFFESGGSAVGSISTTNTATSYNISSDYRLKQDVQPLVGGLARISALKPSIYKWKIDGSSSEGFLAHELASVVPLAVTGEKDAVNEDGSIKPQQVDLSKVVPILVAAIQELTARVQTLETR